jgi:protein ImuB
MSADFTICANPANPANLGNLANSANPADPARATNPESQIPNPGLYAAVYHPPSQERAASSDDILARIAADFSPRFELHRDDLVVIDISGLTRLLGPARTIGEELQRTAAARGMRAHVAIAATQTTALVLAQARPGLTIVEPGGEAAALAPIPIDILVRVADFVEADLCVRPTAGRGAGRIPDPHIRSGPPPASISSVETLRRWGLKTLGEIAALPAADLTARLGRPGARWQTIARGADVRPLVPALDEERFESSLDLEWPIEGLEPLSFVLTRLLEPISTRLERRDRGAAVLHVVLRLVTKNSVLRSLQLPSPLRDVRTLRTLALLDLDAHPPGAAVDRVQVVVDPTPARVLQHTLFTRAHPTVEQMSTLLARLGALMGQDRIGAAVLVDSYRPGAFAMQPFATDHDDQRRTRGTRGAAVSEDAASSALNVVVTALRRCRQPVPARVAVAGDRPVRVTTDRGGFAGGTVLACAGPWRTSGNWWSDGKSEAFQISDFRVQIAPWNRDEWDVALSDGAVYRIFCDRDRGVWFVDAIVD